MAVTTEIAWGDGSSDKIYLTRDASEGNQTVLVSSDANTGAARSKVVTFSASGASPVTLTVNQAAGKPPLPTGYLALTYVENPLGNSAYIKTGVNAGNTIGFFVDALSYDEFSTGEPITFGCLFGGRYSSNTGDFQLSTFTADNHSSWNGTLRAGGSSQNYNAHLPYQQRFQATVSGTTYSIGGNDYTIARNISSNRRREIFLFALNNNGSAVQFGHGKIWRFWLTDNGTKVLDYYPCKRISDGVVGFYDLVNEVFVPPFSGTFIGVE